MSSGNIAELEEKFERFRILIIGRANSGKTTILQKICNTTEKPEIHDGKGNKIDLSKVEGTRGRGIHDINHELIFRSNPKFVFHDSRGFEAGSEAEFSQLKKFIEDRLNTTYIKDRIHAIWYCIPMDKLDRAVQVSEERFFGECNTGNAPVVVLFTKFDALLEVAWGKLKSSGWKGSKKERNQSCNTVREEILRSADVQGRLRGMKFPPKSFIPLEGMDKSGLKSEQGCNLLLEETTRTLKEELQILLVSAQETNVALCIKYAVGRDLLNILDQNRLARKVLVEKDNWLQNLAKWFPHDNLVCSISCPQCVNAAHYILQDEEFTNNVAKFNGYEIASTLGMQSTIFGPSWEHTLETGISVLIILEHSYHLKRNDFTNDLFLAKEKYKARGSTKVKAAVKEISSKYGKATEEEKVKMIVDAVLSNLIVKDDVVKK